MLNIAAPLVEMARRQPDTPALLEADLDDFSFKMKRIYPGYTFRQLDEITDQAGRGLRRLGLTRGLRVALMVAPGPEFYVLTFALFKLGCVVVLIDPGMGVRNLGRCLAEAEPQAFVGVILAHLARVLLGWARESIRLCVTVGDLPLLRWGWRLTRVLREGQSGEPVLTPTEPDEPAAILFTSGSTGVAKGAVYTHGIFAAQVEMLRRMYGIRPGEIDVPTFPMFGLFGPALGMTAILPKMDATRPARVDPAAILDPILDKGVTNLFGSPALLRRVAFAKEATGKKLPTLRRVISAGAPVSPAVIRKVVELLPAGVQVHTPYGATEALPVATIGSDEILGETGSLTEQGQGVCVGRPVEGMSVKILRISDEPIPEWRDDLELPTLEVGEIAVSGPVVTRSYFNRPDLTALHKIDDPRGGTFWHRMGDVGYLDARGRLWFCGRKSQRVVTATQTLFTIRCEGVFNAHPQVLRTALVGVRRDGHVEAELCVELDPDQRPHEQAKIRRELADLGAKYDHTHGIRRFHVHPSFPVDIRHNAKIFREKLAAWAARQTGGLA